MGEAEAQPIKSFRNGLIIRHDKQFAAHTPTTREVILYWWFLEFLLP